MANASTDCQAVLKRLYLYLDGEIAGAECAEIESHLDECRPCLHHFGFERELKQIVARKCTEGIPQGLTDRLKAHLRAHIEGT